IVMKATIHGEDYTFTDVLKLSVTDSSIATKVLIDGTHYNDYVTGYYSGNMTNLINMGISDNIQVKVAQPGQEITSQTLNDVSLLIISAPLKYTSDYTGSAVPSVFEDSFIETVREFVADGGTVIVCGLADYQDSSSGLPFTSYEQINKLLTGIGSTMSINDDELIDQNENGGQPYRLYFDDYNYETSDPAVQQVLNGVKESGLKYSSYSGCSVNKGNGEAVVFGHDTTYSINSKEPAQGHSKPVASYKDTYSEDIAVAKMGEVISLATEVVGNGRVYVSGTVFCSNFEVSSEDTITYSNGIIAKNILDSVKTQPVISSIEDARHGEFGQIFTVEGTVANGTAESGNAFFNTIYIQDENGNGINIFPIDDNSIKRGDRVRVTGSVSEYIGDKQLSAISVTLLEDKKNIVITDTTTKEANNYDESFGKLVRVKGKITEVKLAGEVVESITVLDNSGEACRVFIDGYIGYSDNNSQSLEEFVKTGNYISAVGFVSHDSEGNRLRVRDRSEIMLQKPGVVIVNGAEANKGDQIVFETRLSVSQLLSYISAEVSYNNEILELSELSTSVDGGVLISTKDRVAVEFDSANGRILLEASSNDSYDFTDEKVFVKLVFNVISDEGDAFVTTTFTQLENLDKESVIPTTQISTVKVLSDTAKYDIYLGDVNGDKKISIADAILTQKHNANIITPVEVTATVADVNYDGVVTLADAITLQKVALNIAYLDYPDKY
ncbi:MAG: dockerin type I domain-containing protein, partial [Acutalibacteraceae bacterium]